MKDYRYLQRKYLVNTYPDREITIVRGEGVYLYDEKDHEYLDLMSNIGVNIFGHNSKRLIAAIGKQFGKLTALHSSFNNDVRANAAQQLVKRCGKNLSQVYLGNSGTEAVEAALKFAIMATGRTKFVSMRNSYHGKTLGALSATSGDKYRKPFESLLLDFTNVNNGDNKTIEQSVNRETAAVILEPIQGDGGINISTDGYIEHVRKICDKHGSLLIMDEIQSGLGRTGTFLAIESMNIDPDILTLGKGLAGGIPAGATLVNKKVAAGIQKLSQTSTLGGNPLACAGILAVLEGLDNRMLEHISKIGSYFVSSLKKIQSDIIKDVRGKGLMIGVEVSGRRNELLRKMQANGILAVPASDTVIRFLPPYIIKREHIDQAVASFRKTVSNV